MSMDWSDTFFVQYFFLLTIAVVMIVNSLLRFKQHPRISVNIIVIIFAALLLSGAQTLQDYAKENAKLLLTTFCSFLGYVLNPFCIYFFILMSGEVRGKKTLFLLIPLLVNVIVYLFMFVPVAREQVVYFIDSEEGLSFQGGSLRFTSHIISALYLLYLLYISITKISFIHVSHGLTIIACATFVIVAVIIESFFNNDGKIYILSTTIAFSTVVYYLYLYIERSQVDALTGLFNRETYYHDVAKLSKSVTGIIQFDMNGLKYINDTFGHLEGDRSLQSVASIIKSSAKRNMFIYRLGGDEFVLVAVNCSEKQLNDTITKFKDKISQTDYRCSIGFAFRNNKQTIDDLFKEAEKRMYEDKEAFYKNAPFERRRS